MLQALLPLLIRMVKWDKKSLGLQVLELLKKSILKVSTIDPMSTCRKLLKIMIMEVDNPSKEDLIKMKNVFTQYLTHSKKGKF